MRGPLFRYHNVTKTHSGVTALDLCVSKNEQMTTSILYATFSRSATLPKASSASQMSQDSLVDSPTNSSYIPEMNLVRYPSLCMVSVRHPLHHHHIHSNPRKSPTTSATLTTKSSTNSYTPST
eukprot:PhF_6_TR6127/c0_g1_i1/m.9075